MTNFINITDVGNLKKMVSEAILLKENPCKNQQLGKNKTLGLLFFNPSLRTRLSTQKAALNLGMNVIVMNFNNEGWSLEFEEGSIMTGSKSEHIKEAAQVVSQYCDVLAVRAFAKLESKKEDLKDKLPHAVANSFVEMMQMQEADFVITHPKGYELDTRITINSKIEYNQEKAFKNANFIYAKNWSSFNDYGRVLNTDTDWMITSNKMTLTNQAKFLHCLPVRRNVVVTDGVLDSADSLVIQQANNRTYAAQIVLKKILNNVTLSEVEGKKY